jgi:diguanylate cyclase
MSDPTSTRGPHPNSRAAGDAAATPSDIARETLKQLAARKLPPTPSNYARLYAQIAGESTEEAFPTESLRGLAHALPRGTPALLNLSRQFERAIAQGSWAALRQNLAQALTELVDSELPWASLLLELLREIDPERAGAQRGTRQLQLLQLLAQPMESAQLHRRLDALLRDWRRPRSEPPVATPRAATADGLPQLLAQLLREGVAPVLSTQPALAQEARLLAEQLAAQPQEIPAPLLASQLGRFASGLDLAWQSEAALREALTDVLRLIIDNIRLLVAEDNWLHGQLGLLADALQGSLDVRVLEDVARRLRRVIDKQSHLARQISDAQQRLKTMLAGFIERLGELTDSTGDYSSVLEQSAQRIAGAASLDELADVVQELLQHTEQTRATAARSASQLAQLREQVETANQSVLVLQRELRETSELVRVDPLTGALNRKGLDEALEREIARMQRTGQRLCVVVLDLDNFKEINDTHGHLVGDEVLVHIATVLRETLRGNDSVVRFGGEEFVLLLPGIGVDEARSVVSRLQRELTKKFFLANAQKLLLTFSAGVTAFTPDEDPAAVIDRADKAMYAAKHAGKNRVMVAEA